MVLAGKLANREGEEELSVFSTGLGREDLKLGLDLGISLFRDLGEALDRVLPSFLAMALKVEMGSSS